MAPLYNGHRGPIHHNRDHLDVTEQQASSLYLAPLDAQNHEYPSEMVSTFADLRLDPQPQDQKYTPEVRYIDMGFESFAYSQTMNITGHRSECDEVGIQDRSDQDYRDHLAKKRHRSGGNQQKFGKKSCSDQSTNEPARKRPDTREGIRRRLLEKGSEKVMEPECSSEAGRGPAKSWLQVGTSVQRGLVTSNRDKVLDSRFGQPKPSTGLLVGLRKHKYGFPTQNGLPTNHLLMTAWLTFPVAESYILVPEQRATFFTTLAAVVFTLSLYWGGKIWRALLLYFAKSRSEPAHNGPLSDSGPGSYLDDSTIYNAKQVVIELLQALGGGRALLKETFKRVYKHGFCANFLLLFVRFLIFVLWVLWVAGGVYTAKIIADRQAVWKSDRCGIWEFDSEDAGNEAATRADVYERDKEARAGEYARSCYERSNIAGQEQPYSLCDFFSHRNITYTKTSNFSCPFADDSVCVTGAQAVTFDTGLVDAVESGSTPRSRISFVGLLLAHRSTMTTHFLLGCDDERANHTFNTTNDPFDTRIPAYDIRLQGTSWDRKYDSWQPIPELTPPANTTITIMLISPLHIYYLKPSADPIFGADKKCYIEGYQQPFYCRKSDPKARLFACIDRHELCTPSGETCWSINDEEAELRTKASSSPSYWLMKLSLYSSSMYDSIVWRLGNALIAQERVAQFISTPLPDNHWFAEVERGFASSLARIQFDAWEISSGIGRQHEGDDGYVEYTPVEAGDMCGLYKFKSTGYKNVDATAFFVVLFVVPLSLGVLSRTVGQVYDFWGFVKCYCKRSTSKPDSVPGPASDGTTTAGAIELSCREASDGVSDMNEAGRGDDSEDTTTGALEGSGNGLSGLAHDTTSGEDTLLLPDEMKEVWEPKQLVFFWLLFLLCRPVISLYRRFKARPYQAQLSVLF
ncbi:hypothetical protein V8F06_010195 [Rhypophila decipiens]